LVIEPWARRPPLDCSLGTKPSQAPRVAPVKRCQSPISTARPKLVSTPTHAGSPAGPPPAPRAGRGQLADGAVQAVAAGLDGQHRPLGFVNGHP